MMAGTLEPSSAWDLRSLEAALKDGLEGEVRFDGVSRGMYSTDASVYRILPAGVVIPRSADEVVRALAICRKHGVPVTPRGGGTSQCGQSIGPGVQLDFTKYMNRVLELDVEGRSVLVEPGLVLAELNQVLQPHGLLLPLDLSTANRATIGGMVANNSSGTRSIVYGSTIDYVQELKVLLADGTVVRTGPLTEGDLEAMRKQGDPEGRCIGALQDICLRNAQEIKDRFPKIQRRVGGYNLDRFLPGEDNFDLTKLFIGSEGTLGLVLEARFALVEPPGAKVLAVAQFGSLGEAMSATPRILAHQPSAIELMDRNLLDMTKGKTEFEPLRDFIVGDPGAILMIEFMGEDATGLPEKIDALEADLVGGDLSDHVHRALEPGAQARIWRLRQAGLGLSMAEIGDTKAISFVEDTAVAPDDLPAYIEKFQRILDRHQTEAIFYAHASVGLLHIRPAINMKTEVGLERFQGIARDVSDLVLEFGGALSAEHGDGLARSPFLEKMFGPSVYQAFREVKEAFDPEGILNPGKIIASPDITENLQFGPDYKTLPIETAFGFSDFQGFAGAIEQCGGVGACRKTVAGSMCPTFMVTRDEGDTTRGRANALRAAIMGDLGPGGMSDPALHDVMDLCLECKACKSECPTGVDMARLKSEFLYQYYRAGGAPLRSRVLASAKGAAAWGSRLAPLSNLVMNSPPGRWLSDRVLGLDSRRRFPTAVRRTFLSWWKARERGRTPGAEFRPGQRTVVFFNDTFTNHYDPKQGVAGVQVAERLGHSVSVAPRVCCGRPKISKGFLDAARVHAEATTRALTPIARSGLPIVFWEPGCFSAVRDDHVHLVGDDLKEEARTVAQACMTFEEWLGGTGDLELGSGPESILLHAHCHQKALGGLGAVLSVLSAIPNAEVTDADAGCCGMAGSFGYEKEHYEMSRAVGDRKLFPAVRELGPGGLVVAPGFSCRQQVRHFTKVEAVSVMELMEKLTR